MKKLLAAAPLLAIFIATPAHADSPELRYDTAIDVTVTSVASVGWILSEAFKDNLVPRRCRWCYRAADGTDLLNPVDARIRRAAISSRPRHPEWTSSILAYVLQPLFMAGLGAGAAAGDRNIEGYPVDALLVTQATMIAAAVNQAAKYFFARERPFVHFLPHAPEEVRQLTPTPSEDNLSFYSGHTTVAFALATAAGTVASLRQYELAPAVWSVGLSIAAIVGYLRIAADKHYFSDVMTAAVVSSAIGIGVPVIFHAPSATPTDTPTPLPPTNRSALSFGGSF